MDEWHFSGVDRIVAVSDIHGAYYALIETLNVADVIGDDLAWSGGTTHFVITGDLLDRGPDSRRVMDLIIRLEHEALVAGGRVHQLLGNHEVMNLIGDLRYVSDEEYAAFLDIETVEEREFWYRKFRGTRPPDSDESAVRWEFDEKAPPGYFGHRRAFRRDGTYGKWLLEKPLMVVINDTVFTHGGIPPMVAQYGLAGVNGALMKDLYDYLASRDKLRNADVISPIDRFREVPTLLMEKMTNAEIPDPIASVAQFAIGLSGSPLHGPAGPTWYRGTATCSELVEGDALNVALAKVGADRVVIGHTPTITRQVQQRMNGRIVEIDTGMLKPNYGGSGHALIIEGDELSVVNQDGRANLLPITHPLRVGHESMAIDDAALANTLRLGTVNASDMVGTAWRLVQVADADREVFAYFREQASEKGFMPELAAYRLDRMLGLGMVPVTVRREIDGQNGTLQFVPAETMTERERVADGEGGRASCSLQRQKGAMFVFDALINNAARTPSSMMYSPEDWYLMLVDHEHAFSTLRDWPAYLGSVDLTVGDQWRTALLELDDKSLRASLGDVLNRRHLKALGARRDALIDYSKEH